MMKTKLTLLVAGVCLASSSFAAPATHSMRKLEKQVQKLTKEVNQLKANRVTKTKTKRSFFPYMPTVLASPYLGVRAAYDASDLLTFLPSMNEDLKLLEQRQKVASFVHKHNIMLNKRPIIELSGQMSGQILYNRGFAKTTTTDINLSGAELDILGEISPWATGYMVFSYDDLAPSTGARVTNSNIRLDRGFLTIGQLSKCPLYFTLGQVFVPFGKYEYYLVTTPLTQSLMRLKERAAILGFSKYGIYSSLYAFKGDSYVSHGGRMINNWGANLGYSRDIGKFSIDIGGAYVANLADSEGMQNTGAMGTKTYKPFKGFGSKAEQLAHRIPAYDMHATFAYGPFKLVGEYIGALRSFAASDVTFNGKGAKVGALDTEAIYSFNVYGKPSNFVLGYGQTWQALAFNLPYQSYIAKIGTSLWRDTIESLEYRHDVNYSAKDTYSGKGLNDRGNNLAKGRNIVTLQFTVYF